MPSHIWSIQHGWVGQLLASITWWQHFHPFPVDCSLQVVCLPDPVLGGDILAQEGSWVSCSQGIAFRPRESPHPQLYSPHLTPWRVLLCNAHKLLWLYRSTTFKKPESSLGALKYRFQYFFEHLNGLKFWFLLLDGVRNDTFISSGCWGRKKNSNFLYLYRFLAETFLE